MFLQVIVGIQDRFRMKVILPDDCHGELVNQPTKNITINGKRLVPRDKYSPSNIVYTVKLIRDSRNSRTQDRAIKSNEEDRYVER